MSVAVDNRPPMGTKKPKTLKTFLADAIDWELLSIGAELLSKAKGEPYSEAELIRRSIRAHVATFVLKEAPKLLKARATKTGDDIAQARATRDREDVERLSAQLRELMALVKEMDS